MRTKRNVARLAAMACVAAGALAVGPTAVATEAPTVDAELPALSGDIGGGGSTECPRPYVAWELTTNPIHVQLDASPGKICLAAQ